MTISFDLIKSVMKIVVIELMAELTLLKVPAIAPETYNPVIKIINTNL